MAIECVFPYYCICEYKLLQVCASAVHFIYVFSYFIY